MKSLQDSVRTSLDSTNPDIFPYLPYILQDSWGIGASFEDIKTLIEKHFETTQGLKVLDLGCGKGAVSIQLAQALGCSCVGIDGMPEFIDEARTKASQRNVNQLCAFLHADIRLVVEGFTGYDIIILGAIGPVLGNYYQTLSRLKHCLSEKGIIIIDDGYLPDTMLQSDNSIQNKELSENNPQNKNTENDQINYTAFGKEEILKQASDAGFLLKEEIVMKSDTIINSNQKIFEALKRRCEELIHQHPSQKKIFEQYIKAQEGENSNLENNLICSTMLFLKA